MPSLLSKILPFKRKKSKPPKVSSGVMDVIPFSHFEGDYIYLRKGYTGYMEILQMHATDIESKHSSEVEQYIGGQLGFLRTYLDSFKEIDLNFPTNCETQRRYWEDKLNEAKSDVQRKFIERKLYEFDFLEENRTNREFFIMIFGKTKDELERKVRDFKNLSEASFPCVNISNAKKQDILYLLNNQNSKIMND